jgi:hypothetical protein
MGNMSEKFMISRCITLICNLDVIQEELPHMCVWKATIWVLILSLSKCRLYVGGQTNRQ